jgi:putative ABC transport system permease protein
MSWYRRLRNLVRSERLARDIDREMAFHIDERAEALRALGMSDAEALREARRRFGNRTYQGERTRDADVIAWMDSLAGDVRYALRALRRAPAFTIVAVASLALGVGANTAIYTLIDAVVLRPLPVPHPEQLVQVTMAGGGEYFSNPIWERVRDRRSGFASLAAFGESGFNVAEGGEARRISGSLVSGEYFTVFGVRPALGRLLSRTDDVRGCPGLAVLGNGFWQSEYGGRREVVGERISLDGKPFQIVGATPKGFSGPEVGLEPQVYVPICSEALLRGEQSSLDRRSSWWLRMIGRRDLAVGIEQLDARVSGIAPAVMAATVPPNWGADEKRDYQKRSLSVRPVESGLSAVRKQYTTALLTLMGAVGLVLLIACANVANLLLARATAREREVAIRLAIGAARRRLIRQLLTESAILALIGAAIGLLVARWGTRGLVALISSSDNPISLDLALSGRVLAFTALVATFTAMIFGLIPAWRGTRVSPQSAMKSGGRGVAAGHTRFTIGKTLVVVQVALSLTLLVGAGLLIGSLRNLTTVNPGLRPQGILLVSTDLRRTGMPRARQAPAQREILDRMRALPAVDAASSSQMTPFGTSSWNDIVVVDGFTAKNDEDALSWFNEVSDGYFTTLGTRLLAGRDFGPADVPRATKSAIVNEAVAKKFFAGTSPLGKQLRTKMGDGFSDPYTIVGVVESAKYRTLREETSPTVYLAASQDTNSGPYLQFELRTDADPRALVPAVKSFMAQMHPAASLEFNTLTTQIAFTLRRERLMAVLSGLFGVVALSLSMLGLYGVMAYNVTRRKNEIGVRIALGADRSRVLRMVMGDVVRVVAVGLVLGIAGAVASGKLVTTFLFGLEPAEPAVMALAVVLLASVALVAGFVPAWRASRLNPVDTLREE